MKRNEDVLIYVYADWIGLPACTPLGVLTAKHIRGKEIFAFEYDKSWLHNEHALFLDPNLGLFQGQQYLPDDKPNFGLFLDSSPDRWGRLLMRRRESLWAKDENRPVRTLRESDYLLGVFDGHRMGGLRFKQEPQGEFLNKNKTMASPPWTSLRDLEYASLQLEREDAIDDPLYSSWLNMLILPGSSLGGARPKSGVVDESQNLWIAKFPSNSDDKDSGAWEFVLNKLASQCGITVPEAKINRFTGKHHTFMSKRFDRTIKGERIHFASAMTLLGYNDGADSTDGVSYLEMAAFLIRHGASVTDDLEQLWRRILFNIMVSNTDDHLRNHGFLLTSRGWVLSPAFDMNPNEQGTGLHLNISETDNYLDVSLALNVAKYFKINSDNATRILKKMTLVIRNWRTIAKLTGIPSNEIELMKNAFNPVRT